MKLIDVSVPLDAALPTCPDNTPFSNTPFSLEPMKRVARGERSNVSTLHMSAHGGTHAGPARQFFDDRPGGRAEAGDADRAHTGGRGGMLNSISAVDLSAIHLSGLIGLPVRVTGADGAPARVVPRRN